MARSMTIALLAAGAALALALAPAAHAGRGPTACEDPTVRGSGGNDTLRGTSGPDVIAGYDGNDTIKGLAGGDVLCGDAGMDQIEGGDMVDRIRGGKGQDDILGGDGSDKIDGGRDADEVNAGLGFDSIKDPGTGSGDFDRLNGGDTGDTFKVSEKEIFCICHGDDGADTMISKAKYAADDPGPVIVLSEFHGDNAEDAIFGHGLIDGADENDHLVLGWRKAPVVDSDDTILAGNNHDILESVNNLGDDTYDGQFGQDTITAGPGDDELLGGPAPDALSGGGGDDTCDGGDSNADTADGTCETILGVP